jgi:uncharacterized protein with HEPN domain
MPSDQDTDRLLDIHEYIGLARRFAGTSRDEFLRDRKAILAVTRCLEVISEASRHLDRKWQAAHADIPWSQIAGAGNVYRHDYPQVHPGRVWDTVENALPMLIEVVDAELRKRGVVPE